ncbi:inositol monophosphatase family protein [Nocardioides cynanchi]|uniref:inositol monophosphatase family protein n=1 Tax=Nocardioides cynanchi TaxID=2558918 RepID=UPI001243EC68|nr:inositol monophosphatase family protein [Nocardioides cynanchi]
MTSATPAELRDLALAVAREAGELVVRLRSEGVEVAAAKSSATDIVTEADRACERLVLDRLLGARPDDGIVGEEGSARAGSSGVVWIVDPIDATVNYLYGLPHFAVSIAAEVDGEVVAGVVVAPVVRLEYAATLGGGATCNGTPVAVRHVVPLGERLVGSGFSYEIEARTRQAGYLARLLPRVRDLRRIGCCSLDICYVASGSLDAYVEEGAHIWDHAAAGLVLAEAGGVLEVTRSITGKRVLIGAPREGFDDFRAAVVEAGFVGGEGPHAGA